MKITAAVGFAWWLRRGPVDQAERKLDEQLENSFPASDPPSFMPGTWQAPRHEKPLDRLEQAVPGLYDRQESAQMRW